MGRFKERLTVCNLNKREKCEEIVAWVDSGATIPLVPKNILERLNVPIVGEAQMNTIEGKKVYRKIADVFCKLGGRSIPCRVVVGEGSDQPVIGVALLETLGFDIDLQQRKLKKVPLFGL